MGFLLDENAEIIGNPDGEQMKNKDAKEQNGNEEKEKKGKWRKKKWKLFWIFLLYFIIYNAFPLWI